MAKKTKSQAKADNRANKKTRRPKRKPSSPKTGGNAPATHRTRTLTTPARGSTRQPKSPTASRAAAPTTARATWQSEHERALSVMRRHWPRLKTQFPFLLGCDVGPELTDGKYTYRPAIRLWVPQKIRPMTKLPANARLPEEIEGVPVDVLEGEFRSAAGSAIGAGSAVAPQSHPGHIGTVGLLVRTLEDATMFPHLLTCAHVVDPNNQPNRGLVIMVSGGQRIGRALSNNTAPSGLHNFLRDTLIDAALVEPNAGIRVRTRVTSPDGVIAARFGVVSDATIPPLARVWKDGATTDKTWGVVESIHGSSLLSGGEAVVNHVLVRGESGQRFARPGDSGAVVVMGDQVIGLLRAVNDTDGAALCSRIDLVAGTLGIDILF